MQKWKVWLAIGTIIMIGCQAASPPVDKGLKPEPPQEEEVMSQEKETIPPSSDTDTLEAAPPAETREVASLPKEPPKEITPPKLKWGNAPDFTLEKLGGGTLTLSNLAGKVIVLDFWATWCPPCRAEIPGFVELYSKYKDKGVEIIGLSLDQKGESVVMDFAQKYKINYPLMMATQEVIMAYGGIRSIPTTFLIDQQGNVKNYHIGFTSKEVFESEIKALLTKGPEVPAARLDG